MEVSNADLEHNPAPAVAFIAAEMSEFHVGGATSASTKAGIPDELTQNTAS